MEKEERRSVEMSQERFTALVVEHQNAMYRTARSILHTNEDAEDAVQEAICKAYTHRNSLRDPAKARTWLLRITANTCYDQYHKRRPTTSLSDLAGELPAPEIDWAEQFSLWEAVQQLPDEQRAVVTLFYYEGLSVREVAHILAISQGAVRTRLTRARARLRQVLEP